MGRIFNIQRFSTHDGPGIRTTVFFKGCPLRCKWCHNPEGQSFEIQPQYFKEKCIVCGTCKGEINLDNAKCCPSHAMCTCGTEMSAEKVISFVLKDAPYYGPNAGGITFSGGECLAQPDFLLECLSLSKYNGLNTAIDTSGYATRRVLEDTVKYCDLYLYDIKCARTSMHKRFTGVDNTLIIDNLRYLATTGKPIWIRIPVITGFNAEISEMEAIADILDGLDNIKQVTLMPYHSLGKSKYATLGLNAEDFSPPSDEVMNNLNKCFEKWTDQN
ncbi:MAG: glycyl-radical enzyme activating protein [Clostridia bacterium]|nr:glycyl-radical enzyme activating protein [Clostridia bacterium]